MQAVSIAFICIAIILSIFIGVRTLFQGQGKLGNYFLIMQMTIILYLIGFLLLRLKTNDEEGWAAIRVMYAGGYLIPVFAIFSLCAYYNIKLHTYFVKIPMVIFALSIITLIETAKFHNLVLYYDIGSRTFTFRLLFPLIQLYPIISLIGGASILLYNLKKQRDRMRQHLIYTLICQGLPIMSEIIYIVYFITNRKLGMYFTPYVMTFLSFFFYMGAIRYNIFGIIASATSAAIEFIKEGLVILDDNHNYISSNPAARTIFPEISDLHKGDWICSIRHWPWTLNEKESGSHEFSIGKTEPKFYEASIHTMQAGQGAPRAKVIIFRDVTASVNARKTLINIAYLDPLTDLYKRSRFFELAHIEIERARRMSQPAYIAMLDLDHFKQVNDRYGHKAGDLVLKSAAGIIHQTIRSYDLLGRYGGEEFIILITGLNTTEALGLLERIRKNISEGAVDYEGMRIDVTCSIGLSQIKESESPEESVKRADEALYEAKSAGRNQVKMR